MAKKARSHGKPRMSKDECCMNCCACCACCDCGECKGRRMKCGCDCC